jgi:23S rRNA (adenine1618-N6)-methyltransferase
MEKEKKKLNEKENLHPRNKHRERYNFKQLIKICPKLSSHVFINDYNNETINFAAPESVKLLNKALLKQFYGISNWDIPKNYLCPPIPGRADYIHYIADLLASCNDGIIPKGSAVKCLDIGVGANCIYPLIGNSEYGWNFIGSEVDRNAFTSAKKIIETNKLDNYISIRKQSTPENIFTGIINTNERFDVTICNPPFHSSAAEANEGTTRKLKNLNSGKKMNPILNFGGQSTELWCKGGEQEFICQMIRESAHIPTACFWFTSLVSKSGNLAQIYFALEKVNPIDIKTFEMKQGNKISRFVAWTFLNNKEQKEWQEKKWNHSH